MGPAFFVLVRLAKALALYLDSERAGGDVINLFFQAKTGYKRCALFVLQTLKIVLSTKKD